MNQADIILKSRAIFDAVGDKPYEGFIAIENNKILNISEGFDEIKQWADEKTTIIDCGEGLVMPGLIDAHMHFFDGIFQNSRYICRQLFECRSAAECVEAVKKFANEHTDYERITAIGWYIPLWEDKTLPHKSMLDEIESDRPVYLMCADGHSFWLNSKALEECRIDPGRELLFGSIEVDENGEANGLLHELDACGVCAAKAQELPDEQQRQLILDFMHRLSGKGITSVTDMAIQFEPVQISREMEIMSELEKEGKLNIRLSIYPSLGVKDDFTTVEKYRERFNSEKLNVGGLKAFVDGVHGNHTALLLEPYADKPDCMGNAFLPYETYRERITAANDRGFGVKLHCTGEGATKMALDAYEESFNVNTGIDVRNSIEHVEIVRHSEFERMNRLNVTATMQPVHLMHIGNGLRIKLGAERTRYEYAIKTMLTNEINVALSSDYPVAPYDPITNIYFAITRCDLEGRPVSDSTGEKITLAEALKAYTYGGAYCLHAEDRLGTLEKNKLADIIVFNKNLFALTPQELLKVEIDLTISDGKIVYKKD